MMVMMMAITPSLNASMRPLSIIPPHFRPARGSWRPPFPLPRPQVKEVGDHLRVLDLGTAAHRLVTGARLRHLVESQTARGQRVQPLTERAREARGLERLHAPPRLGRSGLEQPMRDLPFEI